MYTALIWQVAGTAVGIFSASLLPLLATCRPDNGMRWVVVLQKPAYVSLLMYQRLWSDTSDYSMRAARNFP